MSQDYEAYVDEEVAAMNADFFEELDIDAEEERQAIEMLGYYNNEENF